MSGLATYRPTEADFAAVGRGSFRQSLRRRRFRVRIAVMAATGFAMGLTASWLDTGVIDLEYGLAGAGAALLWFAMIIAASYLLIPQRSKRLYRQQRTASDTLHFSWDEQAIRLETEKGRVETTWSDYHDWYEDRQAFGFGLNERLYHFAPKRVLSTDQIADIRAHASAFCGRAR